MAYISGKGEGWEVEMQFREGRMQREGERESEIVGQSELLELFMRQWPNFDPPTHLPCNIQGKAGERKEQCKMQPYRFCHAAPPTVRIPPSISSLFHLVAGALSNQLQVKNRVTMENNTLCSNCGIWWARWTTIWACALIKMLLEDTRVIKRAPHFLRQNVSLVWMVETTDLFSGLQKLCAQHVQALTGRT